MPSPEETPNHRWWLLAILVVATVSRAVNYAALADGPCLIPHESSDMAFFEEWRDVIADGDLLTDRALHPLHAWHRAITDAGLDPTASPAARDAAARQQWNAWYGGKRFHQEPLYPYALALTRGVFGPSRWPVHLLQMALGLLTLLLVHRVTRHNFGEAAGLIATGIVALYAPAIFYELYTLRTTAIAFCSLALIDALQRTSSATSTGRFCLLGAGIGLAALLKSHFLLFGVLACGWALLRTGGWGAALRRGAAAAAGLVAVLVPLFVRNLWVGAPLTSSTSVGAVTFAATNHADYRGYGWAASPTDLEAIGSILTATNGDTWPSVGATLETHDGLASYLGLLWTKFTLVWNNAELPNNVVLYFVERFSTVLALAPVTFAFIAATAFLGLIGAVVRRRASLPLLLLIALSILQLVAFYNLARFRLPLAILLACLSGFGVVWLFELTRSRRFPGLVVLLALGTAFGIYMHRPPPQRTLLNASAYRNAARLYYAPKWREISAAGDWETGRRMLADAIAARPDDLDDITRFSPPREMGRYEIAQFYASAYANYARCLQNLGAASEAQRAAARAQDLTRAVQQTAEMLRQQGR